MPRKTLPEDIEKARQLRAQGLDPVDIAFRVGYSVPWVYTWTRGYAAPPPDKPVTITKIVRRTVEPNWLPAKGSALRERLMWLARRGFDVPPSKQADWDTLSRSGIRQSERVKLLGLE